MHTARLCGLAVVLFTFQLIYLSSFCLQAETNTFKLEHSRRREIALPVLILRWCIRSLLKNPICTSTCKFKGNISSKLNTAAPIEQTVNLLNRELNRFNFYLWQRVHSMQQLLEFQLKCSFNTEILRKSFLSTEDTGHDSWMDLFFNQDLRSHSQTLLCPLSQLWDASNLLKCFGHHGTVNEMCTLLNAFALAGYYGDKAGFELSKFSSEGNKTTLINYSSLNLKAISFVLYHSASVPSNWLAPRALLNSSDYNQQQQQ